jgi:pyruvate/2-oxoglutarate dehydrogenase complex dihydrolipoamide acyltransferase (E2) component
VAVEIHVPELGESVADATVGRWLKQEGDQVKSGEPLVELETDKINFEVEAEQDGVLQSIAKGEGETVNVGEVIGTIGEGDGQVAAQPKEAQPQGEAEAEAPKAEERAEAEQPEAAPEAEETDGHREMEDGASIGALKAFPKINSELQGDELILKHYYDIGVAVNTEEGLVVPVVRDADKLGFADIERGIGELAQKARERRLSLEDLQGGTFTITNGGIFGSLVSTPILNTPQVGILGMHKIQERAVVVDGEIQVRPMMYLTLSYDHRIVDGADAVRFLVRIKELIEDPESLLLEG